MDAKVTVLAEYLLGLEVRLENLQTSVDRGRSWPSTRGPRRRGSEPRS